MELPPCVLLAEAMRLDVGRGVAIVDVEAKVASSKEGCRLDFRAVLLAREEGRDPPELVAFRADLGRHETLVKGPLGAVIVDVPPSGGRVRVRAVLRGERFVAVPLSIDRSQAKGPVPFRAMATSVWGTFGIAARASWVDHGVPVVVTVDPGRDREPLTLSTRAVDDHPLALVVDAGPALGGEEPSSTPLEREAELGRGGARAATLLLTDAPLAIATARNAEAAIDRVREAARLALAASSSSDPLFAALGQRLATALASGLSTCKRGGEATVPSGWPAVRRDLASSGLLDDASAGCPRLTSLLSANHPSLQFGREGGIALREALFDAEKTALPTLGPLTLPAGPLPVELAERRGPGRRARLLGFLAVAAIALLVGRVAIGSGTR